MKQYMRLLLLVLVIAMTVLPLEALAATTLTSPATNLSASVSGSSSGSASSGTVSMTVTGARTSDKNGTLTLTNNGGEAAQLSFSYAASGTYSSFTVAGNAASANGTYSAEIAAGASIEIYMSVAKSGILNDANSATVTLTNVKLEVATSANLTVSHNGLGTVSVGGTITESGTTVEVGAEGTTLAATPASGATFLAWVNTADNSVVSTAASFTYVPTGDASLKAIFAHPDSEACFWGSAKSYLFESLGDAITHASSASNKTIILAASGTLSSGDYTIPSGVTLLLPFDSDGTCYTTSPGYVEDTWTKPAAFQTLTMASGANVTVNGAISVSAKVSAKMGSAGAPTSKYGHIAMNSGSSITVNSGGNLYAWGYITGSGTVNLKSGATAYESFQVVDWRGGTASSGMLNNDKKVFPLSQYYVQNVEAPMVIESGAAVTCSLIADIISVRAVTVKFLGTSGCIFNLTSGSVTKRYDGSTDRLILDINGNFSISSTEIDLILTYKITVSNYVLPINSSVVLNVNNGATLTFDQDASLLPGAQMNIAEGGTVKLGTGKRLFAYDADEWLGKGYVYSSANFRPVNYAHSRTYTRTNADLADAKILVNGTLDASAGYLYTTSGGGNICSTGSGLVKTQVAESSPTLNEAKQSGTSISYESISITSAQLKNADGTFVKTAEATAATDYYYSHGFWHTGHEAVYNAGKITTPAACETDGVKTFTCTFEGCGHTYTEVIPATGHTEVADAAVAATCTTAGKTAGSHCSVCSTVIVAQETVPATGHAWKLSGYTWSDDGKSCTANAVCQNDSSHTTSATATITSKVTTDPSCEGMGTTTYTATFAEEWATTQTKDVVDVAAAGHKWSGTKCNVCGLFKLYATSLRAGDYLDMYFYINASDLTEGTNYYAHVVKTFADGRADVVKDIYYLKDDGTQSWATYQTDYLRFRFDDISAKEMTDEIYVTIYDASGKQVSTTLVETVQSYAMRLLKNLTGDDLSQKNQYLRTTLIDMLNYGAAAQDNFSYNTDDLATAGCDAYQQYATETANFGEVGETDTTNGLSSASVIADNGLTLCLFFENLSDKTLTNLKAYISYTNHNGSQVSWTTATFNTTQESLVGVDITGLAIADGRQLVTCEVKEVTEDENGEVSETVVASGTYSIVRYLKAKEADHPVFSNLMKFVDSAYAYFHADDASSGS